MKTTKALSAVAKPIFFGGAAILAVCVAVAAWVTVAPKGPKSAPVSAVTVRSTGGHFTGKVQYDLLAKLLADDRRSARGEQWLRDLADPAVRVTSQPHPLLKHAAPDFTLVDHRGEQWALSRELPRGPVVL